MSYPSQLLPSRCSDRRDDCQVRRGTFCKHLGGALHHRHARRSAYRVICVAGRANVDNARGHIEDTNTGEQLDRYSRVYGWATREMAGIRTKLRIAFTTTRSITQGDSYGKQNWQHSKCSNCARRNGHCALGGYKALEHVDSIRLSTSIDRFTHPPAGQAAQNPGHQLRSSGTDDSNARPILDGRYFCICADRSGSIGMSFLL